jgi:phenylacetate-CoA ligase
MDNFLTANIKKKKELYSFLVTVKKRIDDHNPLYNQKRESIYGGVYKFLQESEYWSKDEIETYQFNQLKKLLVYAYTSVPYYKKTFDQYGVLPENFKCLDDISMFPLLTKEMVRDNCSDLTSLNYRPSKLKASYTGGTTGIPLRIIRERLGAESKESAFIHNIWKRAGYKRGEPLAVLMGAVLDSGHKNFWIKSGRNKMVMSSYRLNEKTIDDYLNVIREFNPSFIQAYPSTLTLFADLISGKTEKVFPNLKALICVSENLYSWQRELLEKSFQCKIFSHYGHSERVVLAGECEASSKYHIQPEYGYVEILDKNGNKVKEGETGEITATGFTNYAFPLIRYKTMDYAKPAGGVCSCGRNHQLIESIEGRALDYYVDASGSLLPSTGSIMLVKESCNLRKLQFIQEKPGEVVLKIVKNGQFDDHEAKAIIQSLHDRYNSKISFSLEFVNDIPPLQNGKTRYFVQKLPLKF